MNEASYLETLRQAAINNIEWQHGRLKSLIEQYPKGTGIGDFIIRVFEWRADKEKQQYLWSMFNECFTLSQTDFMGSFHSFVVNALLDDTYFLIEYRKPYFDENHNLVWLPNNKIKTYCVPKEEIGADPVVVLTGDGLHDVKFLMEAMDYKEKRQGLRKAMYEEDLKNVEF